MPRWAIWCIEPITINTVTKKRKKKAKSMPKSLPAGEKQKETKQNKMTATKSKKATREKPNPKSTQQKLLQNRAYGSSIAKLHYFIT
jgi:hypothetical protein